MTHIESVAAAPAAKRDQSIIKKIFKDPTAIAALAFMGLIILAAIFAPLITSQDPNHASLQNILTPPSADHLLGGDSSGRDVFARLLFGTRFSLLGALLATSIAVIVGGVSGLIAGYYGKWFDSLSSSLASVLMALPGIVVLLAARSVVGPSAWWAMSIFGILLSASVFRLVRQSVLDVRNELYVDAARVSGLTDFRIIFRHVLRAVRAPFIIQAASIGSVAIAIQAGLEFLGLGDLTLPTWGSMLNDGFARIHQQPLLVIWPSIVIALSCLSLSLIANSVRDALEGSQPIAVTSQHVGLAQQNTQTASSQVDTDTDALLCVQNIKVAYQTGPDTIKDIVHGISFEVRRGEVLGLIGESGSGKTQTAFSILRLLPTGGFLKDGSILWQGSNLASLPENAMARMRGMEIAYIPQEPMSNLDPNFTIGAQLTAPLRLHLKLSKGAARKRALDLLARVGIPAPERVFNSYPHQISGGMAQRVLIAGAISCNPKLLIADEPTTALDVTVQAEILDLLRSLQAEFGMSIILVTHNFGVVADICDRVAVMQNGRIVETGQTLEIFQNPTHPYTQKLFNAILKPEYSREPYSSSPLISTGAAK